MTARLPIHFDVPSNHLLAKDYLVAIESFKTTIEEFNKRIFNGTLDYDLFVLPAEDGSFKGVIEIAVKGAKGIGKTAITISLLGSLLAMADSTILNELAQKLTGKTIQERHLGASIGDLILDMVAGFYALEADITERIIPQDLYLDRAIQAKTDFYIMCLNNKEIEAIGFDDSEEFPIKRDVFAQRITKEKIRALESDYIIFKDAIIISPVDVDVDRVWRLQDSVTKQSISAYMRDDVFKKGFLSGQYPLKQSSEDDRMTVLVEYEKHMKNGVIETKEVSIKTVYSLNDIELNPLPSDLPSNVRFSQEDIRPMDQLWSSN